MATLIMGLITQHLLWTISNRTKIADIYADAGNGGWK